MVCSAFFPSDAKEAPPPQEVKDLIGDCNCNYRGETLLEFLGTTKLGILNVGCKPKFKNSVREEVIDLSMASGGVASKIRSRILDEISKSDHRNITFELTGFKPEIMLWRNPRETDWVGYKEELTEKVKLPC